ncbi:hypothetical protein B5E66_06460 [Faecalibacterium sp. An121]|nr:hypothetical protein B5E66_06460 [Faecalibacterium sp. An121]
MIKVPLYRQQVIQLDYNHQFLGQRSYANGQQIWRQKLKKMTKLFYAVCRIGMLTEEKLMSF